MHTQESEDKAASLRADFEAKGDKRQARAVRAAAEANHQEVVQFDGKATSRLYNTNFVIKEHRIAITDGKGNKRFRAVPNKFDIADVSGAGKYHSGGLATLVKQVIEKKYHSLESQIAEPTFEDQYMDFSKFGFMDKLHITRRALWAFQAKHNGDLPRLHDKKDAQAVADEAKAIQADISQEELDNIKNISLFARTELTACAALYGGVIAQEIVKFTGKYTPINQWIHTSVSELIHSKGVPVDATPTGSRYDHQIALLGKAAQTKIGKARLFLVGCGALGCEFLKGIAMSGYACGGGVVHITDMDTIELSNLSRQFLFRRKHVNLPKSTSAAAVVVDMNPELKKPLVVHNTRVGTDTEDIFTAGFWDGLDFVVNALDNIHAREYTDSKCVLHGIPLFESGTLGTQANSVIALPHVTKSYAQGAVAGEGQGIAMCTLQNFPSLPLHCIEYAKVKFNDMFTGGAQKLADFLEDREAFLASNAKEGQAEEASLLELKRWIDIARRANLATLVELALDSFAKRFSHDIKNLQCSYPETTRQLVDGVDMGPFWRGHKRYPRAAEFDTADDAQVDYLFHSTCILAPMFGLPMPTRAAVLTAAAALKAPEWKAGGEVKIEDDSTPAPATNATLNEVDEKRLEDLKAELKGLDLSEFKDKTVKPTDFEKDDDTNHHIDWITSAAGWRCWNYYIAQPSFQECRMVAGKIIPAIATTTACITGYIQLEMLKYITGAHVTDFRSVTLDLAVNTHVVETLPDPNYEESKSGEYFCRPEKFTVWDHVTLVAPPCTQSEFIARLSAKLGGLTVRCLTKPGSKKNVFESKNPINAPALRQAQKMASANNKIQREKAQKTIADHAAFTSQSDPNRPFLEKYQALYGSVVGANFVTLQGFFEDENETEVKTPLIKWVYA